MHDNMEGAKALPAPGTILPLPPKACYGGLSASDCSRRFGLLHPDPEPVPIPPVLLAKITDTTQGK